MLTYYNNVVSLRLIIQVICPEITGSVLLIIFREQNLAFKEYVSIFACVKQYFRK